MLSVHVNVSIVNINVLSAIVNLFPADEIVPSVYVNVLFGNVSLFPGNVNEFPADVILFPVEVNRLSIKFK